MHILAIFAVFAAPSEVKAANASRWNLQETVLHLGAVLLELLHQTSGVCNGVAVNDAAGTVLISDSDLGAGGHVGRQEVHRLRRQGCGISTVTAARDDPRLLLAKSSHEISVDVNLKAPLLCVASAFLKQAAQREILIEATVKPLITTLGGEGFFKWNLQQTTAENRVEESYRARRAAHVGSGSFWVACVVHVSGSER